MHGLQICLFKYSTVSAICIYAQRGEDYAKGEVGGRAFNGHGNYIVDHGKIMALFFLNFCRNPEFNVFYVIKVSIIFSDIMVLLIEQ